MAAKAKKGEVLEFDMGSGKKAVSPSKLVERLAAEGKKEPTTKEDVEKRLKEAEDRRAKLEKEKVDSAAAEVEHAKEVATKHKEQEKKDAAAGKPATPAKAAAAPPKK